MLPFHWRLAELWTLNQTRALSAEEQTELSMCLKANANCARKLAELYNLSYAASLVDNKAWQDEIREATEKLEREITIGIMDGRSN